MSDFRRPAALGLVSSAIGVVSFARAYLFHESRSSVKCSAARTGPGGTPDDPAGSCQIVRGPVSCTCGAASGEWSMHSLLLSHGLDCYQRQRIIERQHPQGKSYLESTPIRQPAQRPFSCHPTGRRVEMSIECHQVSRQAAFEGLSFPHQFYSPFLGVAGQ